jgi:CheY-like chemotaxis protein
MPHSIFQGRRILVAEDEYFLADELRRELQDAGAEMLGPVASVRSGLQILEARTKPDAASLDVNLGGSASTRSRTF